MEVVFQACSSAKTITKLNYPAFRYSDQGNCNVRVEDLVGCFLFLFFLTVETILYERKPLWLCYSRNLLSPKFDLVLSFTLNSGISHIFNWSLTETAFKKKI
jgi:hypothetical protein